MRTSVKTLLAVGALLIFVGLISIVSSLALQWTIIIGVVFFIIAFFVHRGHKKEDRMLKEVEFHRR